MEIDRTSTSTKILNACGGGGWWGLFLTNIAQGVLYVPARSQQADAFVFEARVLFVCSANSSVDDCVAQPFLVLLLFLTVGVMATGHVLVLFSDGCPHTAFVRVRIDPCGLAHWELRQFIDRFSSRGVSKFLKEPIRGVRRAEFLSSVARALSPESPAILGLSRRQAAALGVNQAAVDLEHTCSSIYLLSLHLSGHFISFLVCCFASLRGRSFRALTALCSVAVPSGLSGVDPALAFLPKEGAPLCVEVRGLCATARPPLSPIADGSSLPDVCSALAVRAAQVMSCKQCPTSSSQA